MASDRQGPDIPANASFRIEEHRPVTYRSTNRFPRQSHKTPWAKEPRRVHRDALHRRRKGGKTEHRSWEMSGGQWEQSDGYVEHSGSIRTRTLVLPVQKVVVGNGDPRRVAEVSWSDFVVLKRGGGGEVAVTPT